MGEILHLHAQSPPARKPLRDAFLQHAAEAYDKHVAEHGEPDASVLILGGLGQPVASYLRARGPTAGGKSAFLAVSHVELFNRCMLERIDD